MPVTTLGRNAMLDGLRALITHAGLLTAQAGKAVTGVASTDIFTATAHGYANADAVVLSALSGGLGLVAGDVYFVIGSTANTFQLAKTVGGAAVNFTTDLTAGTVVRLVELSGGAPAYARKAIAYAAAANDQIDDSTNGIAFDVPAGAQVNYAGYWSAITAGNLLVVTLQTQETFGAQGVYNLTDSKINAA